MTKNIDFDKLIESEDGLVNHLLMTQEITPRDLLDEIEELRATIAAQEATINEKKAQVERLRPAPRFRDGEVYWCSDSDCHATGAYYVWGPGQSQQYPPLRRRLRLSEMPQAVEDFVEAVRGTGMCTAALAAFDREIKA